MKGRPSGEEGFTLIELVVALALLALVVAPLAEVFYTGIGTSSTDRVRAVAIGLASRTSQEMAAVPYGNLGFYGDQPGFAASWESSDAASDSVPDTSNTVELAPTTPTGTTPLVAPVSQVTQSATSFTIQRFVTWADAEKGTGQVDEGAYKRTTVLVCWPGPGKPPLPDCTSSASDVVPVRPDQQTVTIDSVVYPGGLGAYQGPGLG